MRMFLRTRWHILFAALLLALALSASTAYACGCGIYIPRDGDAAVTQERALVTWDGQREEIVMSLGILGSSKEAAVILPIPAQADVKLADAAVFDELDEMTKPLVQTQTDWVFLPSFGASAMPPEAAAGAPVSVLSRQQLGPFDVANLAATDASALKDWLDQNGFQLDPRISEVLQPYIEKQWTFVAVRLQPEQASPNNGLAELSGALSPLQISFDANELVYPMRASALAKNSEELALYVLADHRVDKDMAFGTSRVSFANFVAPADLAAGSTLAPYISKKYFLTKFVETISPAKVHDDFHFRFADTDTTYRDVQIVHIEQDVSGFVLLGCLALMVIGVILFFAIVLFAVRRNRHTATA